MANKNSVTETAKNAGLPEGMDFAQMSKMVAEFNKMKKEIKLATKDMSKEDKKKLGLVKGKKRELSEQIKPFIKKVFKLILEYQDNILSEFELTKTTEKPNGQKWLTFKSDEGITFCVNKYLKPDEDEDKDEPDEEDNEKEE